jgi:cell division protein FtsI/penicillin-binding protein 2
MGISRWRLGVIGIVLALSAVGVAVRLAEIQIVQHEAFVRTAEDEHGTVQTILPQRGAIRDRNGRPLVLSVTSYAILVDRAAFGTQRAYDESVRMLAEAMVWPPEEILKRVPSDAKLPVEIARDVPPEAGLALHNRGIPGVIVRAESRRTYPEGNLASQLIGFLGKDQAGLTGVEATYNTELTGRPGKLIYERDTKGDVIPVGARQTVAAEAGAELILTIDRYIQRVVERELDAAVKEHDASGGSIIVMDPDTGEILALASRPTFDLTRLDLTDPGKMALYRNRAVTDMYEPGSIFKMVTTAAALESGRITPKSSYYDPGYVVKGGLTIKNWDERGHGMSDITQFLVHSANVGAVWISDQLGAERFYHYVRQFGFGEPTNIDLDGEAPGILRLPGDDGWYPVDLATNSFGQGLSATPIQMATAAAAIANGGVLMRPYVVKEIRTPRETRKMQPVAVRRLISEQHSKDMTYMLNRVVDHGETTLAVVPGYHMAGKTGTANIAASGGYNAELTNASFLGYGPIDDPRIVVLVKIDQPKDSPWASVVASPVFSKVSLEILQYLRVPPAEPVVAGANR